MRLRFLMIVLIFSVLTVLTQIGGLIYLLNLLFLKRIGKIKNRYYVLSLNLISFPVIYSIICFLVLPILAKPFGRVALPFTETNHLKPLNIFTCICNRNYVRPELKIMAMEVATEMNEKFPGTEINYLDANFPLLNNFPLFPHISHNDGKKLDLAFCYIDNRTGKQTNECPSVIGYGISEEPLPGETNTAQRCSKDGHWQYSLMHKIYPQGNKVNYTFDSVRTKALVNFFASKEETGMIFIEPHLKTRLKLNSEKIKFHGCHAVRHDDHLHFQLK